jgi:hypothetical protein
MTGNDAPLTSGGSAASSTPHGPPWSLDLIADLHAGMFDEQTAAELRARVEADPAARAVLAALDATSAALASLPPLRMPIEIAARIGAALREEAAARAAAGTPQPTFATPPHSPAQATPWSPPLADLSAARERRRRLQITAGALLAAAAATVGIIVVSGVTGSHLSGVPQAAPTSASDQPLPPLSISSTDLGSALNAAMSVQDYGPLGTAERLDACLSAIRLDPNTTRPLGAREVRLDGRPGVLLVLPTTTAGRLRLLVVPPDCGPSNPAVIADTTVGR